MLLLIWVMEYSWKLTLQQIVIRQNIGIAYVIVQASREICQRVSWERSALNIKHNRKKWVSSLPEIVTERFRNFVYYLLPFFFGTAYKSYEILPLSLSLLFSLQFNWKQKLSSVKGNTWNLNKIILRCDTSIMVLLYTNWI